MSAVATRMGEAMAEHGCCRDLEYRQPVPKGFVNSRIDVDTGVALATTTSAASQILSGSLDRPVRSRHITDDQFQILTEPREDCTVAIGSVGFLQGGKFETNPFQRLY